MGNRGEMAVLVTGATGVLGRAVVECLVLRGDKVKILARNTKKAERLFPTLEILEGDITQENLGLISNPSVDAVYHLAALLDLSDKRYGELWKVNVLGTRNVLAMMKRYSIPHIYFCSTAYTQNRNYYEETKAIAESNIARSGINYTIFKPSIIIGNSKTFEVGKPQHLYVAAGILARVHRRMEIIRKSIEGTLRLPPKTIGCRIKANPEATINLVPVDWVAAKIADAKSEGTQYLTNPRPTSAQLVLDWIGEIMFLNLKVMPEFKMAPHEALVDRLAKPILSYIQESIQLPSSFDDCPAITRELIQKTVIKSLLTQQGLTK